MKFRLKILVIIGLTLVFCVGWGEKQVELLDSGKLIDLDKAIGYTMPGGEWDQGKKDQDKENQDTGEQVNTDNGTQDTEENPADTGKREVISVYVRDEQIYLYGALTSLEGMSEKIRETIAPGIKVELVDDWAEAHAYRKVRNALLELKKERAILQFTERSE